MKPIATILGLLCFLIAGGLVLHLPAGTMLRWAAIFVALALLRTIWRSERAYLAIERDRNEQLARERDFGRARQRERGD